MLKGDEKVGDKGQNDQLERGGRVGCGLMTYIKRERKEKRRNKGMDCMN